MNKILIALISVALVTGCTGKQTPKDTHDHEAHEACQSHDGHDHAAEGHNHEAEGHDHERENLDHQHEGEAGHPAGEIVFTKENETADARIERIAHDTASGFTVRVVTSDEQVQRMILGDGALRCSAAEFYKEMETTAREIREIIDS